MARPSRRVFQCHRPGRVHHAPREGPSWGLEPCPVPRPAPAGVHTGLLTGRTLKDGHARRARRCRDPGRDRAPGSNWHAGYLTPVAHALFGPEVAAGQTPRQRPSHKPHPASADRGAMRAAASGAVWKARMACGYRTTRSATRTGDTNRRTRPHSSRTRDSSPTARAGRRVQRLFCNDERVRWLIISTRLCMTRTRPNLAR